MRLRILSSVMVILIAALAVLAWNRNAARNPSTRAGGEATAPPGDAKMPGGTESGARAKDPGVVWQTPKRWVEEPATGMRLATYVVPAPASGSEAARCVVYYFGPGQGGETDANIQRWIGEFEGPKKPVRRTFKVRQLKVSQVEVTGNYQAHADPAEGSAGVTSGWTLVGAVVEGPKGSLFFKLTGPAGSTAPAANEFKGLLASLRKN
jgi:hypothetical protein